MNRRARRTTAMLFGDARAVVLPWLKVRDLRGPGRPLAFISEALSERGRHALSRMDREDALDVCVEILVENPHHATHRLTRALVEYREDVLELSEDIAPLRQLSMLAHGTGLRDELRECAGALVSDPGVVAVWSLLVQRAGWQHSWRRLQELRELPHWDAIAAIAKASPVRDESELLFLADAVSGSVTR
jgi:hypothetical protein